jgi:tetratricopeptide (TPR) repeat protein
LRLGQPAEAEAHLRRAIALGRRAIQSDRLAAPSPHQLAWLYIWLGQALYAQSKLAEQIRVGEEGLALLGDEINPAEAALIQGATALGYPHQDDRERTREIWHRAAAYVENLPYVEEWGAIYQRIFTSYLRDKQVDEARRWLHILEQKIASLEDERAQGILHQRTQDLLVQEGDLQGGIQHLLQAVTHATHMGNVMDHSVYEWQLGLRSLAMGDLDAADRHARTAFEINQAIGSAFFLAWAHWLLGQIAACRGNEREAQEHLEQALPYAREADRPAIALVCHCILGRMHLNWGEREKALQRYRLAAEICTPGMLRRWHAPEIWSYARVFAGVLDGIEEAMADGESFRATCRQFPGRESIESADDLRQLALGQWFLAPAAPCRSARLALKESFSGPLSSGGPLSSEWAWRDSYGDCRYALDGALAVKAANGRDLWLLNHSAPRLLHPLSSLFPGTSDNAHAPGRVAPSPSSVAIEAICAPASENKPAMGGLLLWIDKANYLCLGWGTGGPREITLSGCVEGQDAIYGRGRLPPRSGEGAAGVPLERVWLRLEWGEPEAAGSGRRGRALCSADGEAWYTTGSILFPCDERTQVGLYACGNIDRSIYHGAYPEGTAIRFESFCCWTLSP